MGPYVHRAITAERLNSAHAHRLAAALASGVKAVTRAAGVSEQVVNGMLRMHHGTELVGGVAVSQQSAFAVTRRRVLAFPIRSRGSGGRRTLGIMNSDPPVGASLDGKGLWVQIPVCSGVVRAITDPDPGPEVSLMPFDHERLEVYRVSLDFIVVTNDVIEQLPRGRSHLADPLHRATTSIVLNGAEGAGKFSKPDQRHYYLSAIGSATAASSGDPLDVRRQNTKRTDQRFARNSALVVR